MCYVWLVLAKVKEKTIFFFYVDNLNEVKSLHTCVEVAHRAVFDFCFSFILSVQIG